MLCSNCSAIVKPIVAIDIDGTLGDYHGHFLKFAADYLGYESYSSLYDGSKPMRVWFCEEFVTNERTWRDIKLAYRQGAQKRSMPAFIGAADLVKDLRDQGAEIWITTTRPYLRLDGVDPDTRFWLYHNHIEFDHLLYDDHKYKELANRVDTERVVAVLDDIHEDLIDAETIFGKEVPLMMKTQYNIARWNNWDGRTVTRAEEARNRISHRLANWLRARASFQRSLGDIPTAKSNPR